jgi:hypothetical protein
MFKPRLLVLILLFLASPLLAQVCELSQTTFNFPQVMQGLISQGGMYIYNNSDDYLEIDVQFNDQPHFSHAPLHTWMPPWSERYLRPNFHPQGGGYFEAVMSFGNELCAEVLFTGTGLGRSCAVEPEFLDFGEVALGSSASRTALVTNTGDVDIPIAAETLARHLAILGPTGDMAPGETWEYELIFTPEEPGNFQGTVDWMAWYPTCDGLTFTAAGEVNMNPGDNRVGVFFDTGYSELLHYNDGNAEFLTGYLVLTNPAPLIGVAGWELLPSVAGSAYITSWDIQGDFINAGQHDNLIIGLGGEPLPPAADVLLATCQIYVAESPGETIAVQLKPVWNPTIPGRMAWLPAGGDPLVMQPFTGVENVAWIKTNAVAAVPDPDHHPDPEPLPLIPEMGLLASVPNPFNPSTEVQFNLPAAGATTVRVFDLNGRLVRTLVHEHLNAGPHARVWNGRDETGRRVASGAYYLRLEGKGLQDSRKVLLLK